MGFGNPPGISNPNERKFEHAQGTMGTAPNTTNGGNNYVADLNTFMPWDDANSGLDGLMDFDLLPDPKPDATNAFLGSGIPSVNNFLPRDDANSRSAGFMDFDFFADPVSHTTNAFSDYIPQDITQLRSRHNVDGVNSNFSGLNRPDANSPVLGIGGTSSNTARIQNSAGGIITDRATLNPFPAHGRTSFLEESDNLRSGHFPSSSSYRQTHVSAPEHLNLSVNPAYFPGQSYQQHNFLGQHGNISVPSAAGSSSNSGYDWRMGMPFVNPRLGQGYHSRHGVGSPAASHVNLSSPEFMFPVAQGNSFQSTVGGGTFHNRIGTHPNDYATARGGRGRIGTRPNDYATARGSRGPPPVPLASHINPYRPSQAAGQQQHGITPPFPMVQGVAPYPSVPRLNIGGSQASPRLNHQALKRPATENSYISTSSQRRRVIPQPRHHPQPPQQIQRARAPAPATTPIQTTYFHLKCRDVEKLLPPTGQKCSLCKRDVSYTAEGRLHQPTIPPAVAILPCGHVFHDQCLQNITPPDESKNPPCIPCAISNA